MDTFKQFYKNNEQIDESLGDILGDIKDAAKAKIKQKISDVIPQGVKDVAKRLFNVENEIMRLINGKQFKELGMLLVEKRIPQNFTFKRIQLFGKNKLFGAPSRLYRDIPLFFAITAQIMENGFVASLGKKFGEIESGGIDITTYLNRLDSSNRDIITFILTARPKSDISKKSDMPSNFEQICSTVIKTMLTFGHTPSVSNNLAVHTAIRMNSLPIFKAFFENKYPIKITPELQRTIDKMDNTEFSKYVDTLSGKKALSTSKVSDTDKILIQKKYGFDIDETVDTQYIKSLDIAKNLTKRLYQIAKLPLDASFNTYAKDDVLKALLFVLADLKLPTDVEIK